MKSLYIVAHLNLATGGNWTNFPTTAGGLGREDGDHFPSLTDLLEVDDPALKINYVRVYKAL